MQQLSRDRAAPRLEVAQTSSCAGPDGLTVDEEGGVWVGLYGGGAALHPRGHARRVIEVPAKQVTACTFGGRDLDQLFITTSREDLKPGEDPLAGSLFRAAVHVGGMPVREFVG
jgi:sugar lactone lactonase YvrE